MFQDDQKLIRDGATLRSGPRHTRTDSQSSIPRCPSSRISSPKALFSTNFRDILPAKLHHESETKVTPYPVSEQDIVLADRLVSRDPSLSIRHLRVDRPLRDEIHPRALLGTPVALVDRGTGVTTHGDPAKGLRVDELLNCGTVLWVSEEHPSHDTIEGIWIAGLNHELRRAPQLRPGPRSKKVASVVRHGVG